MTLAFRYTEASRLAPFEYLAILWPILADLVLFGQPLTHPFLLAPAARPIGGRRCGARSKAAGLPSKSKTHELADTLFTAPAQR